MVRCTSCKRELVDGAPPLLSPMFVGSKSGECIYAGETSSTKCAHLTENRIATSADKDVVCTMRVLSKNWMDVSQIKDPKMRAQFQPVAGGKEFGQLENVAFALCDVKKFTTCISKPCKPGDKGMECSSCRVKKQVDCIKVCKPDESGCQHALCKGQYGRKACTEVARMA